jgi:low affinity Fe/Cu permease
MARPSRILTSLGVATASPYAFAIVVAYALLWAIFGELEWHGVATLATWAMTLIIQRAEHRDTQAIHAKLDELLRTERAARTELTRLDEREPEEIERMREREQRRDRQDAGARVTRCRDQGMGATTPRSK